VCPRLEASPVRDARGPDLLAFDRSFEADLLGQRRRDQVSVEERLQLLDRQAQQLVQRLSSTKPVPLAVAVDENGAANPG